VEHAAYAIKAAGKEHGVLYDLGSGRGDFLIRIAALLPHLHGIGIEKSLLKVWWSRARAALRRSRAVFVHRDIFAADIMKKSSTIFLQVVIVLIGIGALALLLWEPHIEGVNAHATLFEMYSDPFIALVYIGSIPFFVALYQAFKVLGICRTK
jgi:hypothetical protein